MNIKILEIKENEDGTATLLFDYDEEFRDLVEEKIGKEPTEQDISDFVVESIQKGIDLIKQKEE